MGGDAVAVVMSGAADGRATARVEAADCSVLGLRFPWLDNLAALRRIATWDPDVRACLVVFRRFRRVQSAGAAIGAIEIAGLMENLGHEPVGHGIQDRGSSHVTWQNGSASWASGRDAVLLLCAHPVRKARLAEGV